MSVRQSLLAILDQGACYGYQLRAEFDRRTGSTWPLNVGQIYNTLDRLERDGLVRRGDADELGHVYWHITETGRIDVRTWLDEPVARTAGTRDALAIKLAVAATLPGVDAADLVRRQREVSARILEELRASHLLDAATDDAEDFARSLIREAVVFQAEAEVRWLDHLAGVLAQRPAHAMGLSLSTQTPKRGRPVTASVA
ncbi:PadR family transcriptional regulator [Microbacterium sp. NPDC077184]|uniref:PadR family transcriptional regulator n=1 Tax=Microbacterium sp. NPDC077184 TaxID=3154764 RepID=UPI00343F5C11